MKILLIDDNDEDCETLKRILSDIKVSSLRIAHSGQEGLDEINAALPDCILLDNLEPDVTGLDLIKEIRKKTDAPIIMVTGHGDETIASAAIKLGADDYIPKNLVTPNLLMNVITKFIHAKEEDLKKHEHLKKLSNELLNLKIKIISMINS